MPKSSQTKQGLLLPVCAPDFPTGVPVQCIQELITDIKADPTGAIKNPAIYQKMFWALGCLSGLLSEAVKFGLISQQDIADAFAFEDESSGFTLNGTPASDIGYACDQLGSALADMTAEATPDAPVPVKGFAFTIGGIVAILGAITTIYKIWRMLSGGGGGDHSRHITRNNIRIGRGTDPQANGAD